MGSTQNLRNEEPIGYKLKCGTPKYSSYRLRVRQMDGINGVHPQALLQCLRGQSTMAETVSRENLKTLYHLLRSSYITVLAMGRYGTAELR